MGRLITSSIITGSLLLIGIFTVMAFVFSRSLRTGLAMLVTLAIIPVVVRGYIAYLGMPLDFITASAANLDLGMGVDAMIYLTMFAKRDNKNLSSWEPWSNACSHLWRPVGTNFVVICCGFGTFCFRISPLPCALGCLSYSVPQPPPALRCSCSRGWRAFLSIRNRRIGIRMVRF
jgi:predicted RND superfamily exporter protein